MQFAQPKDIHEAVSIGDVRAVRYFLRQEHDVNARDASGNTPLLRAICIKDEDSYNTIVQVLIENGADVNASNGRLNPLYNAVFMQRERSVEMLLKNGAVPAQKDLLHVAADRGGVGVLQLLLADAKCKDAINTPDEKGRTPVYLAAKHGREDCLKMLIDKGADLSPATLDNETVMEAIFEGISSPVDLIIDVLDNCLHFKAKGDITNCRAEFLVLAPERLPRQMDVISSMLVAAGDEEKTEVLQHPLIELYLVLKWARIRYFFFLWIAAYVVFVLSLSSYIMVLTQRAQKLGAFLVAARCFLFISVIPLFGHAILQGLLTHKKRLEKYEIWLNLACTSLSLIVAVAGSRADITKTNSELPNWVLHVASLAVLMAWMELMLLIGRLPAYGYYALMFSTVLQNVIKVLLAFICLVVGFALSFSIQFHDQFSDPWSAVVKTTVMMMGEFQYSELFDSSSAALPATSRVIFLMFIILTSIVLMNLMIGVAVSDIQSLQKQSHAKKLEKQAEFLSHFEKVIYSKQLNSKFSDRSSEGQ